MSGARGIAVVGGGIIGSTIAWRLAQQGWRVTLFEKSRIGGEASWAAAGMLAPGGELDDAAKLAQIDFFLENRRRYGAFVEELRRETGLAIDYLECGALDLAYSEEEWSALQRTAERQREYGIVSRPVTVDQVHTLSPHIETAGLAGALFYPDEAVVAPRELMAALEEACRQRGVDVRVGTAVDDIQIGGNVQIHGQQFAAAVISAGAWSGHIRVNGRCELPAAEPVKGHLLGFELPLGACPTIVRHKDIYLFQRGTGAVVAGASVEHVGYEREVDEAVWRPLLTRIRRVLPVLEKVRPVEVWTGLRPKSDAMHIGAWKDMPLFLAYGHYRNGILLAPVTAERIAQALA